MDITMIFGLQFFLSVIVWGLICGWVVMPALKDVPGREVLFWLALPHAFRHVGMVFLVPGVVASPLPEHFALPAAYGDLATGILAIIALVALRKGWGWALIAVWVFNIVGTVDLVNALRHIDVPPRFGAAWYIPTFLVPLLLVTHVMMFAVLVGKGGRLTRPRSTGTPASGND